MLLTGNNLVEDALGHSIQNGVGGNLVGIAAELGPLAENGGATKTHATLIGSPAIDAGNECRSGRN